MEITGSSEIRALFDDLLVLRIKIGKIKEYYTNITTTMSDDLNELKATVEEDISWMDAQLTKLTLLYSELSTEVNNFVAKSSGDLIQAHVEYQYMINLYKKYMTEFYTRMTSVEIVLEASFLIDTNLTKNSSIWDFKYTRDPLDNTPINLYFESVNWTPSTRFVEVSNNRFFASNKDGMFFDVNYNTKSCEVYNIKSLYHNNRKDAIYRVSDIIFDEITDSLLVFYVERVAGSTTETPYIASFNISLDKPITTFVATSGFDIGQSYYFIGYDATSIYFRSRNYIYGINRSNLTTRSVMTPNVIVGAAIFQGNLYYASSSTTVAVIDKLTFASVRNYSMNTAPLITGDTGVMVGIHATNSRIYIVTVLSIYSTSDACATVTRESRVDGIGVPLLSFSDTNKYTIDKQDTIYYLYNRNFIYAVSSVGTVVMSPTKLSDRVIAMDSETYSNTAGYAINDDTTLIANLGSNIDFSACWNNKLIVGSFTGKSVASCDILTGYWTKDDGTPLVAGKTGPAIYANSSLFGNGRVSAMYLCNDTLYVGTDIGELFSCVLSSNTWTKLNAGTIIGVNPIYSLLIKDNILIVAGQLGRVGSYDLIKAITYTYDGDTGIRNTGSITGSYAIRSMIVFGTTLIVAGAAGRVCSMSFNNNKWTRYNGSPDDVTDIAISSIVYNDGTAFANATIEKLVLFTNIIIAVGYSSRVASVYVGSNAWTKYTGVSQSVENAGPGIFNAGTALGNENIKDAFIVNKAFVVAGYKGRIASFNLDTYGWTRYDGIDIDDNKSGAKLYYDGMSISSKNILSITHDKTRGNIIFVGESCVVGTMNISLVEIYLDTVSKLYYIGKKTGITNDFDSTLIEFSKSNFVEKKVCRPPREFNTDPYIEMYNGNSWVFKNNGFVYRTSNDLTTIHRSMDTGITYNDFPIVNSTGLLDTDKVNNIIAHVTNTGVFIMHVVINNNHKLIIGDLVNGTFICKMFSIASIDDVVFQQVADTATNDSYLILVVKDGIFNILTYDLNAETIAYKRMYSVNYANGVDNTAFKEFQYSQDMILGITSDMTALYANSFTNISDIINLDIANVILANPDLNAENKLLHVITGLEHNSDFRIIHAEKIVFNSTRYLVVFYSNGVDNTISMYLYRFINTFQVSKVYSKSILLSDYIKDVAVTGYNKSIGVTKIYEYMYRKERQLIIGLNLTIPETIPLYKHMVLAIDFDAIGAIETSFRVVYAVSGIASLISVDYKDKHVIVSLNTTGTVNYQDYLIRFDIVDSEFVKSLNSIKDIWLSQSITSSYMNGANGKNGAVIISKSRSKTHAQELLENVINDQDIILYHPNYGMMFYNSEKGGYLAKQDKETGLPQFSSRIKSIDGFKGNIADVIAPILERNTVLASGASGIDRNTANIAGTLFFRQAPVGTVVSDTAALAAVGKVMIRPNNTMGTLKEREYYLAKANFENGGVSGVINNDASSITMLASLNGKSTLPVNLNSTLLADIIVSKEEYDSSDPTKFVENVADAFTTPTLAKTPYFYSDLYVKLMRGTGYGILTVDGVYAKTVSGIKRFVPYFKNRYPISYELDSLGSTITTNKCDVKSLLNGYSLFSSYMSVVGAKGVLPVADMYIDIYNNKLYYKDGTVRGGIKSQEFVSTPFNAVRLTQEIEKEYNANIINTPFVIKTQGIDKLIKRKSEYAYDRIDSFAFINEPYKYIPLYWAPNLIQSFIEGNDSLLSLSTSVPDYVTKLVGNVRHTN